MGALCAMHACALGLSPVTSYSGVNRECGKLHCCTLAINVQERPVMRFAVARPLHTPARIEKGEAPVQG